MKQWMDLITSMDIPLGQICIKWIVFGIKYLCDEGLGKQSKYVRGKEELMKKVATSKRIHDSEINICDKKKLMSICDEYTRSLETQTHWFKLGKDNVDVENAVHGMKVSMIFMAKLIVSNNHFDQIFRKSFLSIVVLLLDPFNEELFTPACTAINILFKNGCCDPSDFQNPYYFVHLLVGIVMRINNGEFGAEIYQLAGCISTEMFFTSETWKPVYDKIFDYE